MNMSKNELYYQTTETIELTLNDLLKGITDALAPNIKDEDELNAIHYAIVMMITQANNEVTFDDEDLDW